MDLCPYCAVPLATPPKRRTDCPSCRRPILIRTGKLCTEEKAISLDYCKASNIEISELIRTRERLSTELGHPAAYLDAVAHFQRQAIRATLVRYKADERAGLIDLNEFDVEIIGGGECPECSKFNGRRFAFNEFERTMPLPILECTHKKTASNPRGLCRCTFGLARKSQP